MLVSYHDFSVGGLASVTMQQLWVPAGIILLGLAAALALSGQMDLLCLGDSMALSLGVRVKPCLLYTSHRSKQAEREVVYVLFDDIAFAMAMYSMIQGQKIICKP